MSIFSFILFTISIELIFPLPLFKSNSTNLCSTSSLCCKHRSSRCVVQKVLQNHSLDINTPCYCDHSCTYFQDCCPDYISFCRGLSLYYFFKLLTISIYRYCLNGLSLSDYDQDMISNYKSQKNHFLLGFCIFLPGVI